MSSKGDSGVGVVPEGGCVWVCESVRLVVDCCTEREDNGKEQVE